jgi:molybdopterin molybdotransferase
VYRKARVGILATGDEVVGVEHLPEPYQVRNSNSYSVAAQVKDAGAIPDVLPVAPDNYTATRDLIEHGLESDLLLLSGGVSAGKYDIVEKVLTDLGAEFYFDRVLIQPGQPLVFGTVRNKFFFGLPGNPASTMVTFAVLARAALDLLNGLAAPVLPLHLARLTGAFKHGLGLTRFLPAKVRDGRVEPIAWQGSSDVPALARANAFLVARDDREHWEAGEVIEILPRSGGPR